MDVNISFNNMQRLKSNIYEFEEEIKTQGFFNHYWYQMKFTCVVQLTKLFGRESNEKSSFCKLCNCLEKTNKEVSELITSIRSKLDLVEEDYKILKTSRDKIYAHQDLEPVVEIVTSDRIKKLVAMANEIYNDIQRGLYDPTTCFQATGPWSIDPFLAMLSEHRKRMLEIEE